MSTARLSYTVEKLREQIEAQYQTALREAEQECAREIDLPARRAAWRAEQEKRVRAFARKVKDVTDGELSDFCVKSMPARRGYGSPEGRMRDAIDKASGRRTWALRRLDGLNAADGTVSLTATMMRDWFGL